MSEDNAKRTLEDDITFERVRHLPRRTRVCSVHRQLSWACNKEVQLYAKESHVNTYSIQRSKTAMQGRYRELQKIRKSMGADKPVVSTETARRASWPNTNAGLRVGDQQKEAQEAPIEDGDSSKGTTSSEKKLSPPPKLPRSTSLFCKSGERKGSNDDTAEDLANIPSSVLARRKTVPAI